MELERDVASGAARALAAGMGWPIPVASMANVSSTPPSRAATRANISYAVVGKADGGCTRAEATLVAVLIAWPNDVSTDGARGAPSVMAMARATSRTTIPLRNAAGVTSSTTLSSDAVASAAVETVAATCAFARLRWAAGVRRGQAVA